MALSETAKLLASLELKDKFSPTLRNASGALGKFDSKLTDSQGRAYKAGQQIGTGIKNVGKLAVAGFGILAANIALGVDSLIKVENAQAQTNAVIKSTGGIAKVSAGEVRALAEEYEGLNATMGDEVIQSGENLLLTFTNIRGQAFEPTLKAALDMNQALGKGPDGLTSTVRILGKALNDPTKGLSALGRVGVTFSKEQTKRIKALQKEGKLYEAQQIILGELEKRFGGSFAAAGDTAAGSMAKFTDSIEDLQRTASTAALPAIRNIADALTELLADPEIQKGAADLGVEIGKLLSKENIKTGAAAIGDAFRAIRDAAPVIKSTLSGVGAVLKGAFDAFNSLPDPIKQLLIGGAVVNKLTGGLVSNIAGGIFGALKAMTVQAGVVNLTGGVVNGAGGAAAGAAGAAGKGKLASAASAAIPIATIVASAVAVWQTQQAVSQQNTNIATDIRTGLDQSIATKSLADLKTALSATNTGIDRITANPLYTIVQGDALNQLKGMRGDLERQITLLEGPGGSGKQADDVYLATVAVKERIDATTAAIGKAKDDNVTAAGKTTAKVDAARQAATTAGTTVARATTSGASMVASAVRNSRPIFTANTKVYVTAGHVTSSTTYQRRVGKSGGSHDTGHASGTGPLP